MTKQLMKVLEPIAQVHGYHDAFALLMDYGWLPTVRVPRHKKYELVPLIIAYMKR